MLEAMTITAIFGLSALGAGLYVATWIAGRSRPSGALARQRRKLYVASIAMVCVGLGTAVVNAAYAAQMTQGIARISTFRAHAGFRSSAMSEVYVALTVAGADGSSLWNVQRLEYCTERPVDLPFLRSKLDLTREHVVPRIMEPLSTSPKWLSTGDSRHDVKNCLYWKRLTLSEETFFLFNWQAPDVYTCDLVHSRDGVLLAYVVPSESPLVQLLAIEGE